MHRRTFLAAAGGAALIPAAAPAPAAAAPLSAADFGLVPDAMDDQSAALSAALEAASRGDAVLVLPPGSYRVAAVRLPPRTRIAGTARASRLVHAGGAAMLLAEAGAEIVDLRDLVLDGSEVLSGLDAGYLVRLHHVEALNIAGCRIAGSVGSGLDVSSSAGRIAGCDIAGCADAGIHLTDSAGIAVSGNSVTGCGNAGIRVWRSAPGDDGTLVTGNRIERIRADGGGTGQNGNGINVYRAAGVVVSGNRIADCAFTAVRGNAASALQVVGNSCLRSGETAIYAEFGFEGAVISGNLVDGAANGISVANFNEGGRLATVSGNIVRNLRTEGPYPLGGLGFGTGIWVEADAAVSGNVVENAPLFGIALGWGAFLRDVAATGNVVRHCGTGIAVSVAGEAGSALVSGNMIAGCREGAVVGYRWAERVGELTEGGAPARVTLAGNAVR